MKSITESFINKIKLYNQEVSKPSKKLTEAIDTEPKVYMNTWKNYNEYGADLTLYGDINGWMTVDDAIEFADTHKEDEPFINDTDNVPFSISEYDNVYEALNYIQQYENAENKEALLAIIEELNDMSEAFEIYENDNYTFFQGVDNDEDLGRAYVEMAGGLENIPDKDKYIDEDAYKESWREIAENIVREDNPGLEEEDGEEFESKVEETLNNIYPEQLEVAIIDGDDLSEYFDYEAFGRDLSMEGYFYASTGAIQTN